MPPEVEASFITIIDSILAASDLDTISEKRIRKGLQASVQYDITPQKVGTLLAHSHVLPLTQFQPAIKTLIMIRFDKFDAQRKSVAQANGYTKTIVDDLPITSGCSGHASPPPHKKLKQETEQEELCDVKTTPSARKHKQESEDDGLSDIKDSLPSKKKKKVDYDSDAAYAARLQAQENSRVRSTRGGGPKVTSAKKKTAPKKKTSAKVKAEDDSDLEGSSSEVKVNRTGGFHVGATFSYMSSMILIDL